MLTARFLAHGSVKAAVARPAAPLLRKSTVNGLSASRLFHSARIACQAAPAPITVNVDGKDVQIPAGASVLRACEDAGVDIPRFCYHDRLSIAGNCRMCLVEVEKSPKPVASCAMPAMPGMRVKTNTPLVMKAREGVMEFLLANHPLDCPICDQGGECDLQDQSMAFGSDRSRFKEFKRTVEDKNLGPFVKTVMTRCIHCTRCVRFATEIAGVETLGTTGRGNAMEIGTYVDKVFDSEISGNIIDLCPVGALTSKPFAFMARPWELDSTQSIDVFDAVGSNIRVDTRGVEVMRILPRLHESVNEEWLGDKSRYAYDGLKRQRLDTPLVKKNGQLAPASWGEALKAVSSAAGKVKPSQMKAFVGDMVDAESIIALKDLFNRLDCENLECRVDGAKLRTDLRSQYLFNASISGIEEADVLLLVGTNPRMEAPIVNARIRKSWRNYGLQVASINKQMKLNYPVQQLGDSATILADLAAGKHAFFETLKNAQKPLVLVGMAALNRNDADGIYAALDTLAVKLPNLVNENWNGISFLQLAAARTAALDLGFVPGVGASDKDLKFVYLLGADNVSNMNIPKDAFVVYQGHHGDAGAARADVVLPGAAYTEKEATYVNMEGRAQRTHPAVGKIGEAREDWKIIRALSELLGATLPYDTVEQVRSRLQDVAPHLGVLDAVDSPSFLGFGLNGEQTVKVDSTPFTPVVNNYFMTDPISRSSRNMSKATSQLPLASNSYA